MKHALLRCTCLLLVLLSNDRASCQKVSRAQVFAWQKRQEDKVRSMQCVITAVHSVTSQETIALLKNLCRDRKNPLEYRAYVVSKEMASDVEHSYVMKWWRQAQKERREAWAVGDDIANKPFRYAIAFDGQIVRTLNHEGQEGRGMGALQTIQSAAWEGFNLPQPYAFLFEHYKVPYSEVFKQATEFETDVIHKDGQALTRVRLKLAKPKLNGVFFFDDKHRLVERQFIRKFSIVPREDVRERHVFSAYRAYSDSSGETIWFPTKVVYHLFMYRLPNGQLVEHSNQAFTIDEIKFNEDIPEERFQLAIPSNVVVLDDVTGLGYLPPGTRPAALFPEEARRRNFIRWLVGFGSFLLLSLVFWIRWRRKKSLQQVEP